MLKGPRLTSAKTTCRIPFFIAAPLTTVDVATADGAAIEIEQRSSEELTHFRGHRVAAEGIGVRLQHHGLCNCLTVDLNIACSNGCLCVFTTSSSGNATSAGYAKRHPCLLQMLQIWNPSFDVTPAHLIEGIITEHGLIPKAGSTFNVAAFAHSKVDHNACFCNSSM